MPISFPRSPSPPKTKATGKTIVSLGYPALFHWAVLAILLGLGVFAAFQQLVPLLAATVFLFLLILLARLWSRYALRRLSVRLKLSRDRVFPDEGTELNLELDNRGMPLPWVEIELELPYRLTEGKRSPSPYSQKRRRWVTAIAHGQTIGWQHPLEAKARGAYELGPLRLRSGDMFGLFPREMVIAPSPSLLVYPRIFPITKLNLPLKALFGEKAGPKSIYEDISRVAGVRDYRYDEPLKRIHWKASAAHNKLQTRQYESSTSLTLLLILDVSSFPEENEEFEQAVSTVASLAYEANRQGFALGLLANSHPEVQIPMGSGQNQLMMILEALARITAESRLSLNEQLSGLRPALLPLGATIVAVTHSTTPEIAGLVRQLEREGCSLLCISTEPSAKNTVTSINGGVRP